MKLSSLKTAAKPCIKTDRLTLSVTHIKKRIQYFTVTIDGTTKQFTPSNHNYLATLKKVIKFIESKL